MVVEILGVVKLVPVANTVVPPEAHQRTVFDPPSALRATVPVPQRWPFVTVGASGSPKAVATTAERELDVPQLLLAPT